jgi:hypothetical protein
VFEVCFDNGNLPAKPAFEARCGFENIHLSEIVLSRSENRHTAESDRVDEKLKKPS